MHVLIVCSGNTCRSPLAAAMLRARLAQHQEGGDVSVSSAGTSAWDGSPASEGSYLVALERGLDLSNHRARMLTTSEVERADLILTVSLAHAGRVADLGGANRVHTLAAYGGRGSDDEIPDPYGGEVEGYREMADILELLIPTIAERIARERRR